MEAIRELVARRIGRQASYQNDGETALHFCGACGPTIEAVRELVGRGADVKRRTDDDETPLHLAAAAGHVEVIRELVARGADVDRRARNDVTPLHLAAAAGHAEAIRELVARRANLDRRARGGVTALHLAAAAGHVDAIRELAALNRSLTSARTDDSREGTTPWWLSSTGLAWARANRSTLVGGESSSRLIGGGTPLDWAEQQGRTEAVVLLRAMRGR